jgi:hypothetical protein
VGRQVVARELDSPEVDGDRSVGGPAAERAEGIGDRCGDLDPGEVADLLVDVSKQGGDEAGGRRRLVDGIGDERQRAPVERVADELWRDVEDPVAEAAGGSRAPS